jgi:hypothetical protein
MNPPVIHHSDTAKNQPFSRHHNFAITRQIIIFKIAPDSLQSQHAESDVLFVSSHFQRKLKFGRKSDSPLMQHRVLPFSDCQLHLVLCHGTVLVVPGT